MGPINRSCQWKRMGPGKVHMVTTGQRLRTKLNMSTCRQTEQASKAEVRVFSLGKGTTLLALRFLCCLMLNAISGKSLLLNKHIFVNMHKYSHSYDIHAV